MYVCEYILNCDLICVAAVRKEISDETDRETGRTKQISAVPIYLSIYSPNGESVTTIGHFWFLKFRVRMIEVPHENITYALHIKYLFGWTACCYAFGI